MRWPSMLATRRGRLAAFFLLYMTEGIPLGFTATAIATQMRRQGLGPAEIGVFVGTLYLPWAWKWLAGPIVDVFHSDRLGRRRGWILAMQILMTLTLLASYPVDFSADLKLFTAIIMVMNAFGATQDVAIDALAVNVLREHERGLGNGLMFAGASVGQAVGGSGVLWLSDLVGFKPTFFFVAAAILSITIFVVLPMREPPAPVRPHTDNRLAAAVLEVKGYALEAVRAFFGTRSAIAGLAFALLPSGAYGLSLAIGTNLAVEFGMTDSAIAQLGLVCTLISAAGCVVGGKLSDLLGRRRMMALYVAATALPTLYMAWEMHRRGWIMPVDVKAPDRPPGAAALVAAFWLGSIVYSAVQGLMYGTRTAMYMDIVNPKVAATQFTAYMAVLNLVIWYSSVWQGHAAERWGYPKTLCVDAVFGLIGILTLPFIAPRQNGAPAANGGT